jgi:hypothetical protein
MKAYLYVCQELADDIECQTKGVIIIGFPLERTEASPSIDRSVIEILQQISHKIVPVRIAAFHICIADHPWFRLFSSLLLQALPIQFRLRSRVHIGKIRYDTIRCATWVDLALLVSHLCFAPRMI